MLGFWALGQFALGTPSTLTAPRTGGDDFPSGGRAPTKAERAAFKKSEERRRKAWVDRRQADDVLADEIGSLYRKLTGKDKAAAVEQAVQLITEHPEAERTVAEYGLFIANEQQPLFSRSELEALQAQAIRAVMAARERMAMLQDEEDVEQLIRMVL